MTCGSGNAIAWFAAELLLILVAGVDVGLTAEPTEPNSLPAIPNLRVLRRFVAPDQLREVTAGHVPVKTTELAALLRSNSSIASASPSLKFANYSATFMAGQLASGKLLAEIDDPNGASELVQLTLNECRLGFSAPVADESAEADVALGNDAHGQPLMIVRGSRLELDWSLANQTPQSTVARFHFVGIRCPFNRLTLDIPSELQLTSQFGIVSREPIQPATATNRWTIELGGRHETRLEVRSAHASSTLLPVVVSHQVTRHLLSTQGAEVEAEMSLASEEPLTELILLASPSLQIARVVIDAQEADIVPIEPPLIADESIRRKKSAVIAKRGKPLQRYRVAFSKPVQQGSLQAFAQSEAVPQGPLPSIVVQNAFWQSRRIEAVVPDHLAIKKIDLTNYRWDNTTRDAMTNARTLAWHALAGEGNVSLWSAPATARTSAVVITRVELEQEHTTGMTQVELVGQSGPAYELSGTIGAGWTVTSVSTEPASALDDWQLQNVKENERASDTDSTRLKIRFATPLTNGRRLKLRVGAHRRTIQHGALVNGSIADLFLPEGVRTTRHIQAFAAVSPLRLDVDDDDQVTPLDPQEVNQIVGDVGKLDYVYTAVDRESEPVFRLRRGNVPWSAGILVKNLLRNGRCDEQWEVDCVPAADGLSEITVQVAPASESEAVWFADRDRSIPLIAKRIVDSEPDADGGDAALAERDTYRIALPPEHGVCTLYGTRSRPLEFDEKGQLQSTPMAIVTAPTAKSHGAIATLGVDNRLSERVRAIESSLESVSYLLSESGAKTAAAFRYDANTEFKLPLIHYYGESTPIGNRRPLAWIEEATTTTRITASGDDWHTLQLAIQNRGRRSIVLTLPSRFVVQRVVLNGQPLAVQVADAAASKQELQLPMQLNRETHTAVIEFHAANRVAPANDVVARENVASQSTKHHSWEMYRQLCKPAWDAAVPIYSDDWRVELPHRYTSYPSLGLAMGNIGARVFGPLGRSEERRRETLTRPSLAVHAKVRLSLFPRRLVGVLAWALGLLVIGITWAGVIGRRALVFCFGVGLALAATAPPPFFVLGTVTSWGILLGMLLLWLPKPGSLRKRAVHVGRIVAQVTTLAVIVLLSVDSLHADDPSEANRRVGIQQAPKPAKAIHVVVPLDPSDPTDSPDSPDRSAGTSERSSRTSKTRRALPSVVYLPSEEYQTLVRTAQRQVPVAPVISDVHYVVRLERAARQLPAECSEVEMELTLHATPTADAVEIPFAAGSRDRLIGTPRLDGVEFQPVWDAAGGRLTLRLQPKRVHKLTLRLAPTVGNRENWLSLWLPIIPHPTATLTVDRSVDEGIQIRAPMSRGVVATMDDASVVSAQLGLAEALDVRWRPTDQAATAAATQWLHAEVSPGQVELKMRVVDEMSGQPIRQLRMRVPAGMTLVPPAGATVSGRVQDQAATELTVEWFEADAEQDVMTFMSRESLVDNEARIQIPELLNLQLTSRQLATRVDPNFVVVQDDAVGKLGLDAFHVAWTTAPPADFLQQLSPEQTVSAITVLPRTSRQVADQSTVAKFLHDRVVISYQVDIVPLQGQSFQHVLELPDGVVVDTVDVSNGPRTNWTQSGSQVCVLAEQPISGPHQLTMTAHLPVDESGEIAMPMPQLVSALVSDSTVTVLAGNQIDVQLSDLGSFAPAADVSTGFRAVGDEKPIAFLRSSTKDLAMPTVQVARRTPIITAKMLTTMQAVNNEWRSQVDVVIQSDDSLDSMSFEIPENWGHDLTITPEARWSIVQLPDRRRRLKVWLPINTPVGVRMKQRLTLSALVDTAQGVRLPRVRPMRTRELTAWVRLPDAIEERTLEWATRRLVQQALPKEFQDGGTNSSFESYRAIGRSAHATLRTTKRESEQPECELAIGQLVVRDDTCQQSFRYYVDPNGHGTLTIELPDGLELTAASVAGRNGQLRRLSTRNWQLEHLPAHLAYRLDLHCLRRNVSGDGRLQVTCPELIGVRPSRTLWQVATKRLHAQSVTIDGAEPLSRSEVLSWKAERLSRLVQLPPESASLATQAEMAAWNRVWVSQLEREFGAKPPADRADETAVASTPERADEWLGHFQGKLIEQLEQEIQQDVAVGQPGTDVFAAGIGGQKVFVRVETKPRTSSTRSTFALLAIMLPFWLGRPLVWEASSRYAARSLPAICVAAGFVWWIWLVPAWIGLVIVCLGAIFSLQTLIFDRTS